MATTCQGNIESTELVLVRAEKILLIRQKTGKKISQTHQKSSCREAEVSKSPVPRSLKTERDYFVPNSRSTNYTDTPTLSLYCHRRMHVSSQRNAGPATPVKPVASLLRWVRCCSCCEMSSETTGTAGRALKQVLQALLLTNTLFR